MAEPKYLARCYANEDVVRRDYVAVMKKNKSDKFVLKVLTRDNEVAYKKVFDRMIESWDLCMERLIYMETLASNTITYVELERGKASKV